MAPKDLRSNRGMRITTAILAVVVLVPCFLGFGTKFLEFVATFRGDQDGIFALLPIINYLMATVGFCFLLLWATMHGMFRDIEQPKYAMLIQEEMLNAQEEEGRSRDDTPPDDPGDDDFPPGPWSGRGEGINSRVESEELQGEVVCHV